METPKLTQGTSEWFEMVGRLMIQAASDAELARSLNVSFVERYTDGVEVQDGRVQGIRFDVVAGVGSYRIGAEREETADIVVEITAEAARRLNSLRAGDPAYPAVRQRYLETGEMRVTGDPARLGAWLEDVHDPIVERTK